MEDTGVSEVLREIDKALGVRPHGEAAVASTDPRIEHLIVLALENRSFDHMLGFLKAQDPRIDGVSEATSFNYPNPVNTEQPVYASDDAPYVPDVDPAPSHDFHDVLLQVYSDLKVPAQLPELTNLGFIYDYAKVSQDAERAGRIMRCFAPGRLPALHQIAREFAICNRWFSSLPGPTWPNRFFMHCASSGGFVDNAVRDYPMPTVFQNLSAKGVNWRVYYHDFPQSLALRHQRQYLWTKYEKFDAFLRNCAENTLPQYSFIEPRYFNEGSNRANDQHPIHGVVLGDNLIADTYEALRKSAAWTKSLLLIVWDEHGGFYDHVRPPDAVPPDKKQAPEFDFTRLGVRVPAVLVSPHIQRSTVCNDQFDHASICATLRKLFALPQPLSDRDAVARCFDTVLNLSDPRGDTPETLSRLTDASQVPPAELDAAPPTELHTSLVTLAEKLVSHQERNPYSEREAAQRVNAAFERYLANPGQSPNS